MNYVEKYQINDVIDRLQAKYGNDWDRVVPFDDPDLGRIKAFRVAIELHDRQRKELSAAHISKASGMIVVYDQVTKQVQIFDSTNDVAKLLSITRSRVNQAVRDQQMIKRRFKVKRQEQYLQDGGF